MNNTQPIIKLEKITKSFSGNVVLNNIDFDLYPGEVHCLVGENGSGKSTMIKIISGAYQADSGKITYLGKTYVHLTPRWAKENGINTIYQEIDLVPSLNVAQNISLGSETINRWGNIDRNFIVKKSKDILDDMGMEIDLTIPVGNQKIAHQQMVGIAKALWLKSRVIILDEPTAVFARSEINSLFEIIRRLKKQGIAILYISHHLEEVFEIGNRVTVLRDGNLVRSGKIDEFDKSSLVKAMVGREIDLSRKKGRACVNSNELFRVEKLIRKDVIKDISFSINCGEIVGVAGLVGAGRTEMARCLVGVDHIDGGNFFLRGKKVRINSPNQALKMGIGMMPESRKEEGLVLERMMGENIAFSLVEKINKMGFVPWSKVKIRVKELISSINIRPSNPLIQVQFMSGGNQQKVVLAKLMAARCNLLIMDEPTRGVDVGARSTIYKLMQQLKADGKGILMISSDMPEILTQADRILIMAKGKIVGELSCKEATEEKILSYAFQLNRK